MDTLKKSRKLNGFFYELKTKGRLDFPQFPYSNAGVDSIAVDCDYCHSRST